MTRYTHGAELILLDSSPFFRFCEGGQLLNLASYLGQRAHITLEVDGELRMRSATTHPELKTLDRLRWPPSERRLELPAPLKQELLDILRAIQEPGDHPLKHAGEISTVLMGQHLGGKLIVLEDRDGKALAGRRGVPRMSTAMLASEMVATGAISEPEGYCVFDLATPPGIGKADWNAALQRAQAVLPPTP
ncbi:MAG: hypothetical protein R2736_06285 [Solirubrobacterales bacterium]